MNRPDKLIELAVSLTEGGDSEGVIALWQEHLADATVPMAYISYAWALLRTGRLIEGFRYLEFRWLIEPYCSIRTTLGRPPWRGDVLDGRTILIQAEQGYGDEFQFVRFVRLVKNMNARVILHALPGTERLMRSVAGADAVVADGDPIPQFDVHAHMLSLPRLLEIDLATIPAETPYIHPDTARIAHWSARTNPSAGLRVGIVWTGNSGLETNQSRSVPLAQIASLGEIYGVTFVSLQKDAGRADFLSHFASRNGIDLTRDLVDFGETAALIANLDLVISIDTSVGHLAGALGKPVWFLLPHTAEWRWLIGRADSP